MMYEGCARPSEMDSAEIRKKGREEDRADEGVRRGREGDKKRTTVVRSYRELHNSWPSHNGAAQSCERADGMSFSFVLSRGDYFSFHSFVSCRSLSPFSLFLLFSSAYLLSLSVFLIVRSFLTIVRVRRILLIPRSFL